MTKYDYAATLAASLGYLAIRQQDAVGCITFEKDAESLLPPRMKQSQLDALVKTMRRGDPGSKPLSRHDKRELMELTDVLQDVKGAQPTLQDALREAAEVTAKFGIVIVISDLLVQRDGLFAGLRYLRGRGHDLIILHVLDDEELDFTLGGPTRFEGLEMPLHLRCDPRMLRAGYLEALGAYLEEIRRGCSHHHADYMLFRTSDPLDAALSTYLSHRHAQLRGVAAKK